MSTMYFEPGESVYEISKETQFSVTCKSNVAKLFIFHIHK
jgi:hypothetical protein